VDVIILFNGANLHPEFLERLSTFNAYMCFDDPESSDNLSKPVAKHFDACFVANIASVDQYRSWGCENVFFRPFGFFASHVDLGITSEQIRGSEKDIDACLFCERKSSWRSERLEYLEEHIPGLHGRGRGWPLGYVSDEEVLEIYRRSRIGINLHNSTGPINFRTYTLPANGVMQICDNKYFLGQIFDLGIEVVGYNEIEEVPDLVRFYLLNNEARIRIATAGYERVHRDYNEVAVWRRQMQQIVGLL
jgi:spore maturation protein CgeB